MDVAIIGTGNVGGALAKAWSRAGHHIILGVRDVNNFKGTALLTEENITVDTINSATAKAEIILIAAAPQAIIEIIKAMGNVSGKIIIDAMNSIRTKPEGYTTTFEAIKDLCRDAKVVKCFNSTGFENMQNPIYNGKGLDMFVAGNSIKGKEIATQLALDAGFEKCYDFGGDEKTALLEQLAFCWINLAIMQGLGRDIAFKIVKR